jgi:hypothetical protein
MSDEIEDKLIDECSMHIEHIRDAIEDELMRTYLNIGPLLHQLHSAKEQRRALERSKLKVRMIT